MASKNPSPATRFSADRPGRAKQKGARDRLSACFLQALADDFEAHGRAAIRTVGETDPAAYLRVVASILPKEIEMERRSFDSFSDEELEAVIQIAREAVEAGAVSAKKALN